MLARVARNDPTDTGGLFIGRRPGTGPLRYRGAPHRGGPGRQRTGSVTLGIATAFAGMIATLMATLAAGARLDRAWRILRRAAGHEQREGALVRIFAATAVVAGLAFLVWFVVVEGPAPSLAPA
jgi:hypothetical protein